MMQGVQTLNIPLQKLECTDCSVPLIFEPNIECTESDCTIDGLFKAGDWVTLGYIVCLNSDYYRCRSGRFSKNFGTIVLETLASSIFEWAIKNGISVQISDKPLFPADGKDLELWLKLKRGNNVLRCHLAIDDEAEEAIINDEEAYYFEARMVCM